MPNRDHDDSQYNRNEGRFESRDEWRDVSNAGSREWDRRGDDFRQQSGSGGSYGQRGYQQPGSFEERREQRLAQQDFGRSGGERGFDYRQEYRNPSQDYRQEYRTQDSDYSRQDYRNQGGSSSGWGQDSRQQSGQDWTRQGSGQGQEYRGQGSSDWSRSQGAYGQGYDRSQSDYRGGQDYGRLQSGSQDWDRSPYARTDYSRSQSNYGARDQGRTDFGGYSSGTNYGQQWRGDAGQYRDGREDESWGQQIRHAGQQAARSIKRAFRGPKNYKRSDERIREDVSDRLGLSDRLDPSEIEVTVSNGEVTLTGTVQSRGEKYLAEEVADDVSGVNEVNNQLRVRREDTSVSTSTTTGVGTSTSTTGTSDSTLRNRNARA
ncbi:MAG: BON domain-containing protein [Polyangiales bacterium]